MKYLFLRSLYNLPSEVIKLKKILTALMGLLVLSAMSLAFHDDSDFSNDWEPIEMDMNFNWDNSFSTGFDDNWFGKDYDKGFDKEPEIEKPEIDKPVFEKPGKEPKEDKKDKEPEEKIGYWQIDFGSGLESPGADYSGDTDLIMSDVGSSMGSLFNPSCNFNNLRDYVDVTNEQFIYDDEDNPTETTVEFEITSDEEQELHLASYTRPDRDLAEEFDIEGLQGVNCPLSTEEGHQLDLDAQVLFDESSGVFEPGEQSELTVSLPTG